jgi:hypothetical protein
MHDPKKCDLCEELATATCDYCEKAVCDVHQINRAFHNTSVGLLLIDVLH